MTKISFEDNEKQKNLNEDFLKYFDKRTTGQDSKLSSIEISSDEKQHDEGKKDNNDEKTKERSPYMDFIIEIIKNEFMQSDVKTEIIKPILMYLLYYLIPFVILLVILNFLGTVFAVLLVFYFKH
jgi:hypothetical protein